MYCRIEFPKIQGTYQTSFEFGVCSLTRKKINIITVEETGAVSEMVKNFHTKIFLSLDFTTGISRNFVVAGERPRLAVVT